MEFRYQSLDEYINSTGYLFDQSDCGGIRELEMSQVDVYIGDKHLVINECPVFFCKKCGNYDLANRMPKHILSIMREFDQHPGENLCSVTMKGDLRFEYAQGADFVYDSRDLNIPGCGSEADMDPTHKEGYSLPVYFDRKVLNSFYNDDDYVLDFFSESYGQLSKKGTDGWLYEWSITFGVNNNDNVVMFLGDLDQIDDDRSLLLLKSYNIVSDHKLMGTEFYKAQMKCEFSEPIIEKRILSLRDGFYKRIKKDFNIDLTHLEDEVEEKSKRVRKPINYSETETADNIVLLDGILNEGVSENSLRQLCTLLGVKKETKDLKTRKLLQEIIALEKSADKAKEMMAPLFYLNDARVCFAHLLSFEKEQELKSGLIKAYSLDAFEDYRTMYDSLLKGLYDLYEYLYTADFSKVET